MKIEYFVIKVGFFKMAWIPMLVDDHILHVMGFGPLGRLHILVALGQLVWINGIRQALHLVTLSVT